jgi:sucrose phosphorylase
MMLGNAQYPRQWQRGMPPAPMGCAYLNFTASHDGIGMRPAEGLLPEDEKQQVIDTVQQIGGLVSMRTMPDGSESLYELNTTFYDAMAHTFEGPDAYHHARFICSQTIVKSLEGIPAFYIHAMLATANDHDGVARRGMNRAINRHRWDYPRLRALLDDPQTRHAQAFADLSERLKIRKKQAAFHPNAMQFTVNMGDERVFGIWRQSLDRHQSIFALHNVSNAPVSVPSAALNLIEDQHWVDLLSGASIDATAADLTVAPYQCMWISNQS